MNRMFVIFAILLFSFVSYAAYGQFVIKDAAYFMKDDNVFSPEEMDEEAEFIFQECQKNLFQREYYDCACVAGAFRQKRDRVEHTLPQVIILQEIFAAQNQNCTNKESIAGGAYTHCQDYSKSFRKSKTEEENESYCKCAANSMVKYFSEKPRLNIRHIHNLLFKAMTHCK